MPFNLNTIHHIHEYNNRKQFITEILFPFYNQIIICELSTHWYIWICVIHADFSSFEIHLFIPFLHRTLIFDGKIPCCLTIYRNFCSITLNGYVLLWKASKDNKFCNMNLHCKNSWHFVSKKDLKILFSVYRHVISHKIRRCENLSLNRIRKYHILYDIGRK